MSTTRTYQEVLADAKKDGVKYVDIRFTDPLGMMHHFTMPLHSIDEEAFEFGLGIDGSSIRGWKTINESDMLVKLDSTTAFVDPFYSHKTLAVIGDIYNPDGTPYNRDPRRILKNAIEYLIKSGHADKAYMGPEPEFFIFNNVRFNQDMKGGFYHVDSDDAEWNMGKEEEGGNLGHKLRRKGGYFPLPPNDHFQDLRNEMLALMEEMGIKTEKHHHEVASAGQAEINVVVDEALKMADQIMLFKYIVKNVAKESGYTVTFMPKPIYGDNGSGMHTHQSLWKDGKNLFAGTKDDYANISQMGMHYTGGILKHAPAMLAFTNPTTNSFKRLVPGFEAPVNLVYSKGNRSASVRIPIAVRGDKARRIEFRTPDMSANPYLAFAAMIMAGLDGIENKIDPGQPADFDLYEATPKQLKRIASVPNNLTKVLDALEKDHKWLTAGDVFDKDFIDSYVDFKRSQIEEVVNNRPHPYEFVLYYDC